MNANVAIRARVGQFLQFDILERRDTPATFGVTNADWNENTPFTLPWAINQANALAGEDEIVIDIDPPEGETLPTITTDDTVTITEGVRIHAAADGPRVVITGTSGLLTTSILVIDLKAAQPAGPPNGGGVGVEPLSTVDISDGKDGGGGGNGPPATRVTISDINFVGCSGGEHGGAITVANGDLWLENAIFNKNKASGNGGAISVGPGGLVQIAGGVHFTENSAGLSGGAIWTVGRAAVRGRAAGLQQQQAFVRRGGVQSSPTSFLDERRVIGRRVEREHRQLEPALSLGLAVAAGGVAPVPAEHGLDVVLEVKIARRGTTDRRAHEQQREREEFHGAADSAEKRTPADGVFYHVQ